VEIEKHLEDIKKAIKFIEANLTEPISVQDVCDVSPISSWQFQRLFRLYTADSIGSYLRTRRLTMAASDLILHPDRRILDIAVEYQFGSQEAFTRAFKKVFGIPPGDAESFKGQLRLKQKLELTEDQLLHNLTGVQREPDFFQAPARSFVGMKIQIPSPFTDDLSYIPDVSNLWLRFNPRRKEITQRKQGVAYGLVLSPSGSMIEDTLPYVASVEVESNPAAIPEGFELVEIKPQLYATFEKKGLADKTRMSMDYIYGFWLPQSDFKRAKGYDIEIFDHRLRLDQPDSVSVYCIPIEPK
jgi:AraC family transcriptional regulator